MAAWPTSRGPTLIFRAAKRYMRFTADRRRIYVRHTGLDFVHKLKNLVRIGGVNGAGKPVTNGIGDLQRLVKIFYPNDAHHRPKNFFLRDLLSALTRSKTVGDTNQPLSYFGPSGARPRTAACLLFSRFRCNQDRVHLIFVHGWTHINAGFQAITHHILLSSLHEDATNSSATFSSMTRRLVAVQRWPVEPKAPAITDSNRQLQIRVGEDDTGFFPPISHCIFFSRCAPEA